MCDTHFIRERMHLGGGMDRILLADVDHVPQIFTEQVMPAFEVRQVVMYAVGER
ncbi:hypothetical protein [Paraburkholderia saeva]|uniref:Uncharacterized protein n=1 Tax=Paraburkholderia saeva TaxID=2777537 RepID=A0A9N8RW81_9BURK|nr:hypothetical protein [Paraburkholderia saeva]CAG4897027.1 hypothetical protein LMG31841_02404 [Paraburkholderia saeva]CAG4911354.1 hypothetical protein R70241_03924 [Paraburkholderia saeva]